MNHNLSKYGIAFALFFALAGTASAQASDDQAFIMQAPSVLTITAPSVSVAAVHDGTSSSQAFSTQQWQVACNAAQGATVNLSTNQAFTHTTDSTYKRDVLLNLVKATASPKWSITVASDQTNYGGADEVATVQAVSTGSGNVSLDLTVTFVTVETDTLAAGDYDLVITGTITAN